MLFLNNFLNNKYKFIYVYRILFFNRISINYLIRITNIFNLPFIILGFNNNKYNFLNFNIIQRFNFLKNKSKYIIFFNNNFNKLYLFFNLIWLKNFFYFRNRLTFFFFKSYKNIMVLNNFYLNWILLIKNKKNCYLNIFNLLNKFNFFIFYYILKIIYYFFNIFKISFFFK